MMEAIQQAMVNSGGEVGGEGGRHRTWEKEENIGPVPWGKGGGRR